ncbi:hypothetical protein C8A05DRAFT_33468 [Staphylotrichum tortipilum]|uniref:C-type lectin domain-containing protein n=1 Tax=Staphylotrichum tortipilum TaxID=2831512 RepID=A0AAN6MKY6_9PEZI|nr:hypothetical protein C8A05DRAFT_33468 [Staphylotrichum longicolle]
MHPPTSLLPLLLLTTAALAQTSTLLVQPTPLPWQDAYTRCQNLSYTIYPAPSSPSDQAYAVLVSLPEERYWVARRTGGSCTCVRKSEGGEPGLEEMPCGDELPSFCGR